jgi:hypothetical protein
MVANGCSINGLVNGYLVAPVNKSLGPANTSPSIEQFAVQTFCHTAVFQFPL